MFPFMRIKLGFKNQIYLVMFSLLILLGLVTFFIANRIMHDAMIKENKNRAVSIGVNLSARLVEPILTLDYFSMKKLLDETVLLSDDIFYTFVLDQEENPVIHSFQKGFPIQLLGVNTVQGDQTFSQQYIDTGRNLVYDYALPIMIENDRLGTLRLGLLTTSVEKTANRIMIIALISTILTILIAALAGFFLFRPITRNINRLHTAAEEVMRGNLEVQSAPFPDKNCWDIMKCSQKECPAYHNTLQRCWYTAGTLCKTCAEGDYAKKIISCQQCRVYRACSGNEIQSLAESFDYMILSMKDHLTRLNLAKEDASKQKILLQTILDGLPDFVSLQNKNAEYVSVNQAFCAITGKTQNEILGKTARDVFTSSHGETYFKEDRQVLETGNTLVTETTGMDPEDKKWIHIVKSPILKKDDGISGIVTSGRDISDYKTIQEQLFHAQKMESVGELAAGVAHEINTPLGIILGYAQILQQDAEQDSQAFQDLKLIEKHTRICSRIVSDLLRFSRRTESTVTRFDIHKSIDDVLNMIQHTYGLEHVTLEKQYHTDNFLITGDEEKIKQVFINLLNNAFDAIGQDGTIGIETSVGPEQNSLSVSISDTGSGILPKHLNKLFDPFFTTKGVGKGTGLGLAVTFGIIKEHGGTIKVESRQEFDKSPWPYGRYNTVFIVTFPIQENIEE